MSNKNFLRVELEPSSSTQISNLKDLKTSIKIMSYLVLTDKIWSTNVNTLIFPAFTHVNSQGAFPLLRQDPTAISSRRLKTRTKINFLY